jgi:hypothetical protein
MKKALIATIPFISGILILRLLEEAGVNFEINPLGKS